MDLAAIAESLTSWWLVDVDGAAGNDVNETDCFIGLGASVFFSVIEVSILIIRFFQFEFVPGFWELFKIGASIGFVMLVSFFLCYSRLYVEMSLWFQVREKCNFFYSRVFLLLL